MKPEKEKMKGPVRIPQELLKELSNARHPMTLGIPKENLKVEKRLAFTPEAVDMIVEAGHRVIFEEGAGEGVNYSDALYAESGAEIVSQKQVFECDLIFKIAPATSDEVGLMKKKTTICSMLQLPDISGDTIQKMAEKSINAVGYELMTADGLSFPVRNSISEIEGAASVSVASELLSNERGGKGILMGGIPGVSPTEIVIIGAGVAGTVSARAALALGAVVKIFDSDIRKLRKLQTDLGQPVFTSVFQPNVLINAFQSADVVIGAMRYINDPVRYVISEEVIRTMKKGALVIDLRINQGGCFETTCFLPQNHPKIFEKCGILHYCVPNISSRVARTTAMALSNFFIPLVLKMGELGEVAGIAKADMDFRSGLYMYSGKLVNSYVAKYFNLPSHDIGLFLSAF
ncbi:MAG: alanine dehydrogenase [Candidatus Symbiothrix sp.]|jgi:alanine dehydrogenase|nr:alanine dehydrogenase [Candidatus Symbiothrix sp.]